MKNLYTKNKHFDIITSESFEMYMPDVVYGGFPGQSVTINGINKVVPTRKFYCSSFSPDIAKSSEISETPPFWTYDAYSFKVVEL